MTDWCAPHPLYSPRGLLYLTVSYSKKKEQKIMGGEIVCKSVHFFMEIKAKKLAIEVRYLAQTKRQLKWQHDN